MSLRAAGIVYRKELTEWLRDRRTLISTVVVPLLLFPLLMMGGGATAVVMVNKAEKEIPKVMVLGGQNSPQVLENLNALSTIRIVPSSVDWKEQITSKKIRAAAEIPENFQASLENGSAEAVKIYYYEGDLKSSFGANHLDNFFKDYRNRIVKNRLSAKDIPVSLLFPFTIQQENVAPPEKVTGAVVGGVIGYMVILLCMTGAMYPAIDLTAGEKERGTMETILSSPLARRDLVLGKFFLVLTAALATATLSLLSMGVSFYLLQHFDWAGSGKELKIAGLLLTLGPKTVASIFVMTMPLAVLFSAVLMTIALFAKSHKEAQSYLMPITFVVMIPAFASTLPGLELTTKLALVPILNISLVCKEIMAGTYHWGAIVIIFISTCVYAAAALLIAIKMFQRESVLFRS